MKILTIIFFLIFIAGIVTTTLFTGSSFSLLLIPLVMLTAMPLMTYLGAKRNFSSNKRISEPIEYTFDKESLLIKGESFNSQLSWEKIYKVTHTKNWILIWQSRQSANCINKRDIGEEQVDELKQILIKHKVKNDL